MDIKLTFLGAAQNVTGSRYLLEVDGKRILVDCGMYQERDLKARNWEPFPVPADSLHAMLLTHAHLDHCGFIPRLTSQGFNGKIHCTGATAEIASIVLLDSGKIQQEDAAYKKRRHEKEGRKGKYPEVPLYTKDDAEAALPLFSPVRFGEPVEVAPGIKAVYHESGHILGAASIMLTLGSNGDKRTILFSGDIGRWDVPILRDPTLFDGADYVFVESTYGNRNHKDVESIPDQLDEIINGTRKAGGNIIIPSFSVERAQEVLYHLSGLLREKRIPNLVVFLDSPMAIRVTEVFQKYPDLFDKEAVELMRKGRHPCDFPGLTMARTADQSKAINQIKGSAIIIAGSGMCTGGRVKHHLVNNISRPESCVLFVGYQAVGTLGRHIVNGADEVRIHGRKHPVKAKIAQIGGFSGHADQAELLRWMGAIKNKPKQVFVTHGEPESATFFADLLKKKHGFAAVAPEYKDEFVFD